MTVERYCRLLRNRWNEHDEEKRYSGKDLEINVDTFRMNTADLQAVLLRWGRVRSRNQLLALGTTLSKD